MAQAPADETLVENVRGALAAAGDPERAVQQRQYMKSSLPFHGVAMGDVRRIVRRCVTVRPPADRASWEASVRALWDDAQHREERYAALTLMRKAVGWALRQHARHDPAWVRLELERLGDRLSPLSRREAAKHL